MSLRANLFLIAVLLLSACGFSPLYGTHSATEKAGVAASLDQVRIDNIPDRSGQYLRNALIDRFYRGGTPADPRYVLHVTPVYETRTDLDITKSSSATRAQLRLDVEMTLVDHRGGTTVLQRKLIAITSYNILQSQFTTRVSEEAARQSALDDIAGQIERHLALHFSTTK
jgi:LPS-assembly lipoprotein